MHSVRVEDYLTAIFRLSGDGDAVTTSALALHLGLAAGTVTGMVKRLSEQGLVKHVPYYGAVLTAKGREQAIRLVRRHRLIERFLVEVLGLEWDRVHDEAERLEHAVSDEVVSRMAAVLGHPEEDPHGAPIPAAGRPFQEPKLPRLSEVEAGGRAVLRRVPDEDSAALRYLAELALVPGAEVEVLERVPFDGPMRVRVAGREHYLGMELCRQLRVSPDANVKKTGVVTERRKAGGTR